MDDRPRQILQLAYVANALVLVAIRLAYLRRTAREPTTMRTPSAADSGLRVLGLAAVLVLPPLLYFMREFAAADYQLPALLGVAGMLISAFGTVVFWRAHRDLGLNWSARLRIRSGHTLVTDGVYRYVRHPLYAAILFCAAGQPLLLQNWIIGPWLLIIAVLFIFVRIPAEEVMMIGEFGEEYRSYMKRTGRILPRWRVQ